MVISLINRGAFPGDPSAESIYSAFGKVNSNYANKPARLDIAAPTLSASFRDDGSGNLGWYVGAAGAADGAQVLAAAVDKATGRLTTAPIKANGSITSNGEFIGSGTAGYVLLSPIAGISSSGLVARGATFSYNPSGVELYAGGVNRLHILSNGSVGIGTAGPGVKVDIAEPGATDCFLRLKNLSNAGILLGIGSGGGANLINVGASDLTLGSNNAAGIVISATNNVLSAADNTKTLGGPSNRWSVVYAGTGTINTSDARDKTPVRKLKAAELAAARDLAGEICVYQWLASVEEKGDAARLHIGMTVQRAIEIMESHGLDPWRYGFICRDEITRKVKVTETRSVQKTEEVEVAYVEIEVRDGVPVQVAKSRTEKRQVVQMVAVVDEKGEPVLREIASENSEPDADAPKKGKRAKPQTEPVMHAVPVMVEEEYETEIDEPAGDRLGFRYDQLTLFIMRGVIEK